MSDDDGASNNELLLAACKSDNLDILEQVLSSDASTFDINHTDGLGNSALHYAARYASMECLEIILYYDGIDMNLQNRLEGDTPLHKAASYAQDPDTALEMVQVLIDRGASALVQNKNKQTPRDVAPVGSHENVREFLENIVLAGNVDARDYADQDDDDSDGEPSDDE